MTLNVRTQYIPQTDPFEHQWELLERSIAKRAFAFLLDPGLGKTKAAYDTAAILFERHHITGMLVLAPNDVHQQWIDEQLPLHLPKRIRARTLIWKSSSARVLREATELLKPLPDRLAIVAMNHEALATKKGKAFAKKFLHAYISLFVLDESHEFKNPTASRTRAVLDLSHESFARRILTGTLSDGNPFDLYAQFNFLNPKILNCDSFLTFKHRYALMSKEFTMVRDKRTGKMRRHEYETVQSYRCLDELNRRIAPFVYRCRKEDCSDLPPKTYLRIPTHLSDAQRAIYTQLLEQGLVLLKDHEAGKPVVIEKIDEMSDEDLADRLTSKADRISYMIKLTLFLKLQQCVAGFVKDDEGLERWIDGDWEQCPRIAATVAYIKTLLAARSGKIIVWCNFRFAMLALHEAFEAAQINAVNIHGGVTGDDRSDAIAAFKDPNSLVRVLLAHPKTMGTGQNLAVAQDVIYYTRSLSFIQRRQSEDRVHRIGQTGSVTIGDLVASDAPTDSKELALLKSKEGMADRLQTFNSNTLEKELGLC